MRWRIPRSLARAPIPVLRRGVPAEAIVLDRIAAHEVFASYVRRNPRLARVLARLTTDAPSALDDAGLAEYLARETVLVRVTTNMSAA